MTKYGQGQPCIVYGRTKQSVEDIAEFLQSQSVRAAAYHAALSPGARSSVQAQVRHSSCARALMRWMTLTIRDSQFATGEIQVIVATVAYGMGVNNSSVRCKRYAEFGGVIVFAHSRAISGVALGRTRQLRRFASLYGLCRELC